MPIGIISAMPEEIEAVIDHMTTHRSHIKGMRTYHVGELYGREIVLVFSRWGKVAAATTATQLIEDFNLSEIVFTGVAGALDENINIGDIVVGKKMFQHDLDGSPIVKRYEVPLLGKTYFETDTKNRKKLTKACQNFLEVLDGFIPKNQAEKFGITAPKIIVGDIASGDQFISEKEEIKKIKSGLATVVCAEMEGAAVAQVCFEYAMPFSIFRTISDKANDNSHIDFPAFAKEIASNYALGILKNYLVNS
ncbi:5'-methylthioadenosine/adenosylhomocysteine nucleosidase [Namhaeicola litoreus]|uniref:adenosylhomocysteine nucleosidase n=1 Tax=Namhaeicola litoreus TaxID=1052145 RepID=A0ABW3Y5T7_9FLAO